MLTIEDFTNLTPEQKGALLGLLEKDPEENFIPAGIYNQLELKHPILRHRNKSGSQIRYEVIDQNLLARGFFGDIYKVICTLSIKDGNLQVKVRQPGKERIVKKQTTHKISVSSPCYGPKERIVKKQTTHKISVSSPYYGPLAYGPPALEDLESNLRENDFLLKIAHLHAKPIVCGVNSTYMVMRHLPGETLKTVLSQNLSIQEKFLLSIAILQAYKTQIAQTEFVHCDLNPQNILVHNRINQFEIFIVDFGMTHLKNEPLSSTFRVSFFTMTKEHCTSQQGTATEHLDIFSLGLNLALLWGYPLDNLQLHPKALSHFPPLFKLNCIPTNLPDYDNQELFDLIKSMCTEEKNNRPNVDDVLRQLSELEKRYSNPASTYSIL